MTNAQPEFDVFLAHNSQDKPFVREIAKQLKSRCLNPWLDEEQIRPGQSFQKEIQEAIRGVKSAAIVVGSQGLGKWQERELSSLMSQCVDRNIPVIPVLLPGVNNLPDNLVFLKDFRWINYEEIDDDEALSLLVWGITGKPDKIQQDEKPGRVPTPKDIQTIQTQQFQDNYYKWLIYKCNRYQTEGFGQIASLSLSNVFVPLKIAEKYQDKGKRGLLSEGNNTNSEEERTIWNFLFPEKRKIVLLGTPGSGKTTLLKHLTFVYASKEQTNYCKQAPELIPVLLLIREVSEEIVKKQLPLSGLIANDVSKYILKGNQTPQSLSQLSQWFEQELAQGRCLIMLDGLDEVADESQRKVVDWIKEQTDIYHQNSFLLTSRPPALPDAYNDLIDISLEIQPFNDKQVPRFIRNWYFELGRTISNEIQAQELENLIKQIKNSSSLKAMVVNPLLLTMICTVHHRNTRVPETPIELYKAICEVLLEKRQLNGVSYQDKQSVLQVLALKLMKKQDTKFYLAEGESWIKEQLACLSNDATVDTKKVLTHLSEIGLLVESKEQYYQFAHLSFQEYLAACQLKTSQESCSESYLASSWWEETILWYAVIPTSITRQLIYNVERKISERKNEINLLIDKRATEIMKKKNLFTSIKNKITLKILDIEYKKNYEKQILRCPITNRTVEIDDIVINAILNLIWEFCIKHNIKKWDNNKLILDYGYDLRLDFRRFINNWCLIKVDVLEKYGKNPSDIWWMYCIMLMQNEFEIKKFRKETKGLEWKEKEKKFDNLMRKNSLILRENQKYERKRDEVVQMKKLKKRLEDLL